MNSNKNPLITAVLTELRLNPTGLSEYQLIKTITFPEEIEKLENIPEMANLCIFKKHFLVMNALYQLQQKLWHEENIYLSISPLNLKIENNIKKIKATTAISADTSLAEYYRDWNNLKETSAEDVEKLLSNFWDLYFNNDKKQDALAVLELPQNATKNEITDKYRQLASQHHPDKGGDCDSFIRIRSAYELLS
ncbi:MAG: molecular chaperone DnaJ [Gammaproteobacteria bacterium]|mgnify:CR=1 FL=1|nr:MAG: molecular chaperone DnaJ [Gammaproteobacteria bacterium]